MKGLKNYFLIIGTFVIKTKFYRTFVFLLVILNTVNNTYSQNSFNTESTVNSYMEFVRENNYAPALDKRLFLQESSDELFACLQKYYLDTLPKIRLKAYYIAYKVGLNYDSGSKNYAINKLVSGCKDDDSGIVGSCLSWLSTFKKNDFEETAIDSISILLERKIAHLDKLLRLIGFLNLKENVRHIQNMLIANDLNSETNIWAARLALARMGEQEQIDYILDKVKGLHLNDDVVYNILPDLIYTRQKKLLDYLIEILQSDEKNCFSANPESSEKIICGYRVMEYLAPVIEDYPIGINEWGDITEEDYSQALSIVRAWFLERKDNYNIKIDTY